MNPDLFEKDPLNHFDTACSSSLVARTKELKPHKATQRGRRAGLTTQVLSRCQARDYS